MVGLWVYAVPSSADLYGDSRLRLTVAIGFCCNWFHTNSRACPPALYDGERFAFGTFVLQRHGQAYGVIPYDMTGGRRWTRAGVVVDVTARTYRVELLFCSYDRT